jgi:uncharacterized protein (DUF2384 family)
MSLALFKGSGLEVSKLSFSPKLSIEYLISLRNESINNLNHNFDIETKSIDVLAIKHLIIPQYKESFLLTALLLKSSLSSEVFKIISNITPKDMLAKILNISIASLNNQYIKTSLNKTQTESVLGFIKIWSELMVLFKNRNKNVNHWLCNVKEPLCGNTPISLMDTAHGREVVSDMIYRIKTGDLS